MPERVVKTETPPGKPPGAWPGSHRRPDYGTKVSGTVAWKLTGLSLASLPSTLTSAITVVPAAGLPPVGTRVRTTAHVPPRGQKPVEITPLTDAGGVAEKSTE